MIDENTVRLKIVAIAKDELAYLPDWIFHHLYFGADRLEIYINGSSDGSQELIGSKLCEEKVEFFDGDRFFKKASAKTPQVDVYNYALKKSIKEGFSHILFLDIDEFWFPLDFKTSLKDEIKQTTGDAISFEWFIRLNEEDEFLLPFDKLIVGSRARLVKTVFKTGLKIKAVNPHNIVAIDCDYRLSGGDTFPIVGDDFFRVSNERVVQNLPCSLILHRMYRSELEYVSTLARGRPLVNGRERSRFKDNRQGYAIETFRQSLNLPEDGLNTYLLTRNSFFIQNDLEDLVQKGREFVRTRFKAMLNTIVESDVNEVGLLAKLLTNISRKDVKDALDILCDKFNLLHLKNIGFSKLDNDDFNAIRKAAFILETTHPRVALDLLICLKKFRPDGHVINEKLSEIKSKFGIKD